MASSPSPVSQWFFVIAFASVASSAGLQWAGLAAQSEAARQNLSRKSLSEFASLLNRMETATPAEKPAVAERLSGLAEKLPTVVRGEKLTSASRRVAAMTPFEAGADAVLQERLRAEIRGLVNETESLEAEAILRAARFGTVTQALLLTAMVICGWLALRARRQSVTA